MRTVTVIAALLLLAPCAARAGMFKCVGADGKVTYADRQCEGKVKTGKEMVLRPDPVNVDGGADAQAQKEKWRDAEAGFQQRRMAREENEAAEAHQAYMRQRAADFKKQAKAARQQEALAALQEINRRNYERQRVENEARRQRVP